MSISKQLAVVLCLLSVGAWARAEEVYVDNVVIILDASGSMRGAMKGSSMSKMAAAKTAIREVVGTLQPSTRVGLLVFGGRIDGWAYPLGPRDDRRLLASVQSISPGGGTPLGAYMKVGADTLLEARGQQYGYGSYRLLVVTDGEASDPQLVAAYAPDILARGIVVDVVGVDMATDHALATRVHSYRRANDPEALRQAIEGVFAEIGKEAGSDSIQGAFDELDGLSSEAALGMVSALISSGNHPIGSQVTARGEEVPSGTTPSAAVPPSTKRQRGRPMTVALIVGGVIIVALIKVARRRR